VIGTSTTVSMNQGNIVASGSASIGGNLVVSGNSTSTGVLTLGSNSGNGSIIVPANSSTYSIGSTQAPFKDVYMTGEIKSPSGSLITVYGNITGSANGLQNATTFRISGQVQTTADVVFNGTGTDKTFQVSLSPSAISAQSQSTVSTSSHQLLVLDTATSELRKINRDVFIGGVFPPGFVSPFGGSSVPPGWLLCDGSSYSNVLYQNLFSAIGLVFGGDSGAGTFNVPDMTTSTYVTTGTNTGTYINYIIKT
jgi:microcystin-dependent protein